MFFSFLKIFLYVLVKFFRLCLNKFLFSFLFVFLFYKWYVLGEILFVKSICLFVFKLNLSLKFINLI